jgi:hypothetical protein
VDATTFDRELENRLHLIESPDGPEVTVDDLPLMDVLIVVAVLAALCTALMWWAY